MSYFSFISEEIAWIENQKYCYNQVKLNLQPSFFRDLFLTYIGVVKYTVFSNTVKCIMEKMRTFLNYSREFECLNAEQKQLVISRNVPLATSFVGITAEWISDGEEQFLFFKNLLTSSTSIDVFVKYSKPKIISLRTWQQKYKTIFNSEEEEKKYAEIMPNLRQFDFLSTFDLEMFTVSLLFHTEPNDDLPSLQAYRNFLLKSLESKMQSGFDTHSLYYEFVRNSVAMSKFPGISKALDEAY